MPEEPKNAAGAKPAAPTRLERINKIASERLALCHGMLSRETLIEVATRQVDHEDAQAAAEAPAETAKPPVGKGK